MARRGKPSSSSAEERRGIQSVEVSAIVLSALAGSSGPLTLKQISDATEMPPSKIHRYLSSFVRTGFVSQDPGTGKYDLGKEALELGLAALSRIDVVENSTNALTQLTEETGATSLLSVWSNQGPIVVRVRRSTPALITTITHGVVLPATRSATGQVFLAFLPAIMTKSLIAAELSKLEKDSSFGIGPKTLKEVRKNQDAVKKSGIAWVDSMVVPGLRGMAAPILGPEGTATAVLSLIGTDPYLADPNQPHVSKLLDACASLSSYRPAKA